MKRKHIALAAFAVSLACLLAACAPAQDAVPVPPPGYREKSTDLQEYIDRLAEYLGCEYEVLESYDLSQVEEAYLALLAQGKTEGFTPVMIVPSENVCEIFAYAQQEGGEYERAHILEHAGEISAQDVLDTRLEEALGYVGDEEALLGEFMETGEDVLFYTMVDYNTGLPYEKIFVAKLPTADPWEAAAYIPMGGYNYCPMPEEQVAVFRYWYEQYGAVPAAVDFDVWELYVEQPVRTEKAAEQLAWEQFAFCEDIIWQGTDTLRALASALIGARSWYFWWD